MKLILVMSLSVDELHETNVTKPKNWFQRHNIITIVLAILLPIFILSAIFSNTDSKPKQNKESTFTTETQPTKEYKELNTHDITYLLQERHYQYTVNTKPDEAKVEAIILEVKRTCPEGKICDLMLWDSESAYKNRDNSSTLSNEYSVNNKEHLIGYLNTGGLFYYYGGNETILTE